MQKMWEEIPQATYGSCVPDTHFYHGKKEMAFHPQVPQLGTVGQTQLTGTLGPLVELAATVEMIKNSSCDGDSSW